MAEQSPAKKLRKQVKGFLCNVSPMKDKKTPYFDALLEHEGEFSKVVSFRPEDHMHFHKAETSRSLVTLEDVILQPSEVSSRQMNVFYTHSSKMTSTPDRGETFPNTPSAGAHVQQLSELLNLQTKLRRVNINVKVIQEVRKGSAFVWDGQYLPRTEYTVADTSGSVSLTVWREHNITIGEWYNITNVSAKQFMGKPSLSTTRTTQIVNIPSQGAVTASEVPTETKMCEIIGANITILFICPHNHKLNDATTSTPTVYCLSCNTTYKSTAIIMKIRGRLDLKTNTGVVNAGIEDEVIRSVLTVEPGGSRQDIIHSFITMSPKQITIRQNNIIKMEDVPEKTETESPEEPVDDSTDFYSPPDLGVLFSSQGRKKTD